MIRSFADKRTQAVFHGRIPKGFPTDLFGRARRALMRIDAARRVQDLATPPSFQLHEFKGARAGVWSISVTDQFRITFRFEEGDASEVRFEDYH